MAAPAEGVQRGKRAAIAPSPWRGVHVGVGVCTFARLGWRYPHLHVRAADTEHARKAEQRRARWFTRAGSRWCVVCAPSARLRTTPRTHRARTQRVHARVYVRVVAAAGVPGSTAMPVDRRCTAWPTMLACLRTPSHTVPGTVCVLRVTACPSPHERGWPPAATCCATPHQPHVSGVQRTRTRKPGGRWGRERGRGRRRPQTHVSVHV